MPTNNICTGTSKERKFEIREADDGFSLFTWADYGGTVGLIHWRENHDLSWQAAHSAATAWANEGEFPHSLRTQTRA